jgi:hypothetical protein
MLLPVTSFLPPLFNIQWFTIDNGCRVSIILSHDCYSVSMYMSIEKILASYFFFESMHENINTIQHSSGNIHTIQHSGNINTLQDYSTAAVKNAEGGMACLKTAPLDKPQQCSSCTEHVLLNAPVSPCISPPFTIQTHTHCNNKQRKRNPPISTS